MEKQRQALLKQIKAQKKYLAQLKRTVKILENQKGSLLQQIAKFTILVKKHLSKNTYLTEQKKELKKLKAEIATYLQMIKKVHDQITNLINQKEKNSSKSQKENAAEKIINKAANQKAKRQQALEKSQRINNKEANRREREEKGLEECDCYEDCPSTTFGGVCTSDGEGTKVCRPNECRTNLDCYSKIKDPSLWGYCKVNDNRQKYCEYKPKCTKDEHCDDNDPCTQDTCIKKYGFCSHRVHCADDSLCNFDICVPSRGNSSKPYRCLHPIKSCTRDKNLLKMKFSSVPENKQSEWLGKCSKTTGCKTCTISAQCDDNKGCTKDSCINQTCQRTIMKNEWCDPETSSQPITVQSLARLRKSTK